MEVTSQIIIGGPLIIESLGAPTGFLRLVYNGKGCCSANQFRLENSAKYFNL